MKLNAYEKDLLIGLSIILTAIFLAFGAMVWVIETTPPAKHAAVIKP